MDKKFEIGDVVVIDHTGIYDNEYAGKTGTIVDIYKYKYIHEFRVEFENGDKEWFIFEDFVNIEN